MRDAWYALRLQVISAVAWLVRIPLSSWTGDDWEDDGGAIEEEDEEGDEEEDNPYFSPQLAGIVRRSLDSTLVAVWPAAHQNTSQALMSVEFQLAYQLHMFNSLSLETLQGAAWELSKLFGSWLPEDTDPSTLIGADWATDDRAELGGHPSVKAELYGFIAESLDNNPEGAVRIVETVYNRFGDPEGLGAGTVLLSHLLVSLAHRFSLNEIPGLEAAFSDDDDE